MHPQIKSVRAARTLGAANALEGSSWGLILRAELDYFIFRQIKCDLRLKNYLSY